MKLVIDCEPKTLKSVVEKKLWEDKVNKELDAINAKCLLQGPAIFGKRK